MLEEAVEVIRTLWEGGTKSWSGAFYEVENARIYTLPDKLPEIFVAASGERAGGLAGRIGDGLITTGPDKEVVGAFDRSGGKGKPRYGQYTACWAEDRPQAVRTALKQWPNAAIPGELSQELPLPAHFEQAAQDVTEEKIAKVVLCGPDPKPHIDKIKTYVDAGFTHVYVHQVGHDQEGFLRFFRDEVMPKVAGGREAPATAGVN
jgi:G6PDH family F420-dependent oxidoreductase